jgi:DNA-binding transcriptional LysR family regulator
MTARTDLTSLETLLAVAEHGSIGAAARALGLRQPSVTDRLQRLERHLELSLLERSPRGTGLTSEGFAVADWARVTLAASGRLEAGAAALRRRQGGQLRVSASMTISEYLVPRWLTDLRIAAPEVSVSLRVGNSEQVADDVLGDKADLGFVEGLSVPRGLRQRVFGSDELVVVVAGGHPWTRRRRPLTAAELAATPLIVRERGSGTRETLARALTVLGYEAVPPQLELGSTAAVKAAVATGQGISVLSRLATADDVAAGRLRTVEVADLSLRRRLRVIWREHTTLSGPAADLVRRARAGSSAA